MLVVVGLVLVGLEIRAQAWLSLVGTLGTLVAVMGSWIVFRQRGERRAEGTPDY